MVNAVPTTTLTVPGAAMRPKPAATTTLPEFPDAVVPDENTKWPELSLGVWVLADRTITAPVRDCGPHPDTMCTGPPMSVSRSVTPAVSTTEPPSPLVERPPVRYTGAPAPWSVPPATTETAPAAASLGRPDAKITCPDAPSAARPEDISKLPVSPSVVDAPDATVKSADDVVDVPVDSTIAPDAPPTADPVAAVSKPDAPPFAVPVDSTTAPDCTAPAVTALAERMTTSPVEDADDPLRSDTEPPMRDPDVVAPAAM